MAARQHDCLAAGRFEAATAHELAVGVQTYAQTDDQKGRKRAARAEIRCCGVLSCSSLIGGKQTSAVS